MTRYFTAMMLAFVCGGLSTTPLFAQSSSTAAEWERIEPEGDTICSAGAPYSFHARRGNTKRLVIFFNGGGACWNAATCDVAGGKQSFVPLATLPHNDPSTHDGIYNMSRADNPVKDWSHVFVSYCTGDVHLGTSSVDYRRADGSTYSIEHKGGINARAALAWTYEAFPDAREILVAGGSAGGVAAPFYAGEVAEYYKQARITVLGEGAGGFRSSRVPGILEHWGATDQLPDLVRDVDGDGLEFEDFYRSNALAFRSMRQGQFNTTGDSVQKQFLVLLGEKALLEGALRSNLADIIRDDSDFVSYSAGGPFHTMLRHPVLYTYNVAGTPLVDWLSAFVRGESVMTVDCADDQAGCDKAPDASQ